MSSKSSDGNVSKLVINDKKMLGVEFFKRNSREMKRCSSTTEVSINVKPKSAGGYRSIQRLNSKFERSASVRSLKAVLYPGFCRKNN